ncbi:MAG: protein-export chaperone SecB [Rhodocyclaceae bacterium]|jgi:preprotein translocase subunit SecB|nr:MAG: protein-export chaperone SecB [Rhodocyclaceae bacterium]
MAETQQAQFTIEKIYVKDLSLEIPNAPQIFLQREQPEVQVQLHTEAAAVDEGIYQCLLTVTVTAKLGEKTMFLVEAGQAGIFQIRNVPQQDLDPILSIACPNILFPYVRETISDTIGRAGFPPVLLAPVNFEVLYQQRLQQQQQGAQQPAAPLQ